MISQCPHRCLWVYAPPNMRKQGGFSAGCVFEKKGDGTWRVVYGTKYLSWWQGKTAENVKAFLDGPARLWRWEWLPLIKDARPQGELEDGRLLKS